MGFIQARLSGEETVLNIPLTLDFGTSSILQLQALEPQTLMLFQEHHLMVRDLDITDGFIQ